MSSLPPPEIPALRRSRHSRRYTISGPSPFKHPLQSPRTIDVGSVHSLIDPSLPLSNLLPQFNPLLGTSDRTAQRQETVTPTSQLGETVIHVRQVAKLIGRARVKCDNPKTVLIITKAKDRQLVTLTRDMALWLTRYGDEGGLTVYVDANLRKSRRFDHQGLLKIPSIHNKLHFWTPELCAKNPSLFDFVVTLGGDGTVLFASWLFQKVVPPVIPFALGSLGFLTNFDFGDYKAVLSKAVSSGVRVNLRMRFTCTVYRCDRTAQREQEARTVAALMRPNKGRRRDRKESSSSSSSNSSVSLFTATPSVTDSGPESSTPDTTTQIPHSDTQSAQASFELRNPQRSSLSSNLNLENAHQNRRDREHSDPTIYATIPCETFEILNDLVVDRGPSAYMSMLELFGDDRHLTTVQADGLCVATPTGSTAYSLAAGGSLVHPEIPAMLISPICPHTLSFRPMLLPDSTELRVCVPPGSRSTAWASFDGKGRIELKQGEYIKITASRCPLPTVCAGTQSDDWFSSLNRCLRWNERQRQRPFVCVESPVVPKFHSKANDLPPSLPPQSFKGDHSSPPHVPAPTIIQQTAREKTPETLDNADAGIRLMSLGAPTAVLSCPNPSDSQDDDDIKPQTNRKRTDPNSGVRFSRFTSAPSIVSSLAGEGSDQAAVVCEGRPLEAKGLGELCIDCGASAEDEESDEISEDGWDESIDDEEDGLEGWDMDDLVKWIGSRVLFGQSPTLIN